MQEYFLRTAFTFSGMAHPPSTRDFNRMRGNMYEWSLRWNEIRKAYNYSRSFKKIEGICVELFCSKKNMEVRPYPTLPYPTSAAKGGKKAGRSRLAVFASHHGAPVLSAARARSP